MTWFKVDDSLHSHPKTSSASLAAIGLWAVAGSWCGDHLTDGRVPEHMIPLLSRGAVQLADELVAAGLWVRVRDGYRFHQWHVDSDGTRRNPTKKQVEEERRNKAEAGRKGGLARSKNLSTRQAGAKAGAKAGASGLLDPPTRPLPSTKEGRVEGAPASPGGAPPRPQTSRASPAAEHWDEDPHALAAAQQEIRAAADANVRAIEELGDRTRRGAAAARAALRRPPSETA